MKTKNRPRRQAKKRKNEYKKTPRGRKFNPWVYKYFDVTADHRRDNDDRTLLDVDTRAIGGRK